MGEQPGAARLGKTVKVRALIGLVQGIALYFLFEAQQAQIWPTTDRPLFAAVVACAIFVPVVLISALTHLRLAALSVWAVLVWIACAGLAGYHAGRNEITSPAGPSVTFHFQFWFGISLALFVAHSLVMAGASERRTLANYPTYFAVSWKIGLQAVMALLFAGAFWLVLWFGAQLFRLIRIDTLARLIQEKWFWIPATTLAISYALHMTDVRVGIIRGVRNLSCNLLSWLLPLLTLIVAAFVIALPFAGIELLWNTRHATPILLGGAAGLIFLINAAYQDGSRAEDESGEARAMPRVLHIAILIASAVIVVLVGLAIYGLSLRISQYGWTPDRVIATACAIIAACYSLGYAFAAIRPAQSPHALEVTNVATSGLIVLTVLILLTPLADPARISVSNQVDRLTSGKIAPDAFDYRFLRFESGRFGVAALKDLASQTTLPLAAQRSTEMLAKTNRSQAQRAAMRVTAEERASNITVVAPKGQTLPRAFLEADWNNFQPSYLVSPCLTAHSRCEALLVDLDSDSRSEIILLPTPSGQASVYRSNDQDSWAYLGALAGSNCAGVRDALIAGKFDILPSAFKNLQIDGRTLSIIPRPDCAWNGTVTLTTP